MREFGKSNDGAVFISVVHFDVSSFIFKEKRLLLDLPIKQLFPSHVYGPSEKLCTKSGQKLETTTTADPHLFQWGIPGNLCFI